MVRERFKQPFLSAGARRRVVLLSALFVAGLGTLHFGGSLARAEAREAPEFLVIAHAANPYREVSEQFVAEAMLKKTTRWSHGENIRPVDLPATSPVRQRFSRRVLKRSVAAVRSYWQQRIFTGRDVPPPELDSDEAVVRYVSKHVGAIGYVGPHAKLGEAKLLTLRGR
jgi:hypothetical protein